MPLVPGVSIPLAQRRFFCEDTQATADGDASSADDSPLYHSVPGMEGGGSVGGTSSSLIPRKFAKNFNTEKTVQWLSQVIPTWSDADSQVVLDHKLIGNDFISNVENLSQYTFSDGTMDNIRKLAKEYLDEFHQFWTRPVYLRLLVPGKTVGKLIGLGGAHIAKIREQSGARIYVDKNRDCNTRQFLVQGMTQSVTTAMGIIVQSLLSTEDPMNALSMSMGERELRLLVTNRALVEVVGTGGANLKKIRETCGCSLAVERRFAGDSHDRLVVFAGSLGNISAAVGEVVSIVAKYCGPHVSKGQEVYKVSIPLSHKLYLGARSKLIEQIRQMGAAVSVKKDTVRKESVTVEIWGQKTAVMSAHGLLTTYAQETLMSHGLPEVYYT